MKKPSLVVTLAFIRCTHRRPKRLEYPSCGRCGGAAQRDMNNLGEELIRVTARSLMQMHGHTGEPTPLTYAAAVELLKDILPAIKAHPPVLSPGEEAPDERDRGTVAGSG